MMLRNIFLDLDDTILDFRKAEKAALEKTLLKIGVEPTGGILSRYSEINLQQWKRLERGEIDRATVKTGRYRLLFEEYGIDFAANKATHIYEGFLGQGHFFLDGAQDMLESLYGRYRLYISSNGTYNVQKGRIKSADIAKYFDDIFISELIGANKPSKEFFDKACEKIENFSADETLIVGDSLTSDIQGGKNAGFITVWFNHNGEKSNNTDILPDYEIHRLAQLPPLVESL